MIDILILEGKKTLGDQVKSEILTFASLIYTENYYLTAFDLWLLVTKYKIPTIFISQKWILQTKYEKREFVGYDENTDNFAYIIIPGFQAEIMPNYKLVQSDKGDLFISLDKLNGECVERIREAISQNNNIENYLEQFTKTTKTVYEKKRPKKLEIESDSEGEQEEKLEKKKKEKPEKKKKLIIEETISEEFVLTPPTKKTKKNVVLKGNKGTKKQAKKAVKSDKSDKSE